MGTMTENYLVLTLFRDYKKVTEHIQPDNDEGLIQINHLADAWKSKDPKRNSVKLSFQNSGELETLR